MPVTKPLSSTIAIVESEVDHDPPMKGETKVVLFPIPVQHLRHFNLEINDYSIQKGNYELLIGSASDNIRLKTIATIK